MKYFQEFNFDILLITIVITGMIFGLYYGILKQAVKTIMFVVPIIVTHFLLSPIMKWLNQTSWFFKGRDAMLSFVSKIIHVEKYKNLVATFFVAVILFLVLRYLLFGLSQFIYPKREKRLLGEKNIWGRIGAAFLSLVSSYMAVVLFVYLLSPFVHISANAKLTRLVLKTSENIFDVATIHKYQHDVTHQYELYIESLEKIEGKKVREQLNQYKQYQIQLHDLDDWMITHYHSLSVESKQRWESIPNYQTLLSMEADKYIIDIILEYEKSHPLVEELQMFRNQLIGRDFLYFMMTTYYIPNKNELEFMKNVVADRDNILSKETNKQKKKELLNELKEYDFFVLYHERMYSLFPTEDTLTLENYEKACGELLINHESMLMFIEGFQEEFQEEISKDNDIDVFFSMMKLYQEKKIELDQINPYLTLPTKLILAEYGKDGLSVKALKKNALLEAYFIDQISNGVSSGKRFYLEYDLYSNLNLIHEANMITPAVFQNVLDRIDLLILNHQFHEKDALYYFESIFALDGTMARLESSHQVDPTLSIFLLESENRYIVQMNKHH